MISLAALACDGVIKGRRRCLGVQLKSRCLLLTSTVTRCCLQHLLAVTWNDLLRALPRYDKRMATYV